MRRRPLLLAVLASLALPGAASADVTVTAPAADTLRVVDTGLTANSVDLARYGGDVLHIRESAAVDDAAPCEQWDSATVACSLAGIARVELLLGPGDDYLSGSAGLLRIEAFGEAGDDELHDGPGDDLLDGGPGDDDLYVGEGDDEAVGGADVDLLSYADHDAYVVAALPDSGTTANNGGAGENDVLHADIEDLGGSWSAGGHITGNDQANVLGGTHVHGRGGNDELSVAGGEATGGEGDDFVRAENDVEEVALDCGPGQDRLDADNALDAAPIRCETIAPEFVGTPKLFDNHPWIGGFVHVDVPNVSGTMPTEFWIEWIRCSESICAPVTKGNVGTYVFGEADYRHGVYAEVHVGNSAGGDWADSNGTGRIGPARPTPGPPEPPMIVPPPDPGAPYADPFPDVDPGAPLEASVGGALRRLARRWAGEDPRALARRRALPHRFRFPADGTVTFRWTARGEVVARGRRRASEGSVLNVPVRPTKRGRALLRQARRLDVTLSATFAGAASAQASRAFTLRRAK
ncbi:MAG TPA: hypothetical protein VHF89_21015 [Solirubrobacteraceae bacterium]|nr:hypothetical protein [Solirubrobacteraceae bacterium]